MFEKKPDSIKQLNDMLRQNPTWATLANAVTAITRKLIDEPRWKLQRLRHHNTIQRGDFFDTPHGRGRVSFIRRIFNNADTGVRNTNNTFVDEIEVSLEGGLATTVNVRTMPERTIAQNNVSMLGFDYFSDKLDDADYQSLMRYVARYWPYSGDGNFIEFLSFVKRIRLEIFQLNTPDYGDPDTNPAKDPYLYLERFNSLLETYTYDRQSFSWDKPTPPDGFGGVYPTSHVELEHDAIKFATPDYKDITHLFYFLAPIHLVLERFVQAVYVDFPMYQKGAVSIDLVDSSLYEWKPDAMIEAKFALQASIDAFFSGVLILDDSFNSLIPMESS